VLEQQKEIKDVCPHCRGEINTLIVIKKQELYKINECWETITNDSPLNFYCPICHSKINIDELKTKRVIF
jgi:uncharacterized protein YbaR (Trm112 family)